MASVQPCELPAGALLAAYSGGGYADCFFADLPRHVSHAEFVHAFYTTALFKVERMVLAWAVSRPSSDDQVRQLANGKSDSFAAWMVEGRAPDQLLLRDFSGRTRSWLMTSTNAASPETTRLFFGSAVVPAQTRGAGRASMGWAFQALLGFHKLYSRSLLRAAVRQLTRG